MRDVLTDDEISKLVTDAGYFPEKTINSIAINAARLGAKRERERAARVCEGVVIARQAAGLTSGYNAVQNCIEAIRRGEEG